MKERKLIEKMNKEKVIKEQTSKIYVIYLIFTFLSGMITMEEDEITLKGKWENIFEHKNERKETLNFKDESGIFTSFSI